MPKLSPMVLRFRPSNSPDVIGYRLRALPDGTPFTYTEDFAEYGDPVADADGYIRIDLAQVIGWEGFDGVYDIFVTAYDDRYNESDPLEVADANFDFSAPSAPTDGAIE